MTSVWTKLRNFRSIQPIHKTPNEIKGVVVRQGKNNKTVTVRAWWKTFNFKYNRYIGNGRNYHAHDPENFCRIGDIVVIKACRKIAPTKHYFVRNILTQAARFDKWDDLNPETKELIEDKFYRLEQDDGRENSYKLRAMRESINRVKGSNLFDGERVK